MNILYIGLSSFVMSNNSLERMICFINLDEGIVAQSFKNNCYLDIYYTLRYLQAYVKILYKLLSELYGINA